MHGMGWQHVRCTGQTLLSSDAGDEPSLVFSASEAALLAAPFPQHLLINTSLTAPALPPPSLSASREMRRDAHLSGQYASMGHLQVLPTHNL
jgi:hypothetical protein